MTGTVFDIKEFSVYDGPGVRTTVFMKGCPLRCQWCHNPEGLSPLPQLMVSPAACTHCGACTAVCEHPDHCVVCGKCLSVCRNGLRRIAGKQTESTDLACRLTRSKKLFEQTGGGVTFSGGEPLLQWPFVKAVVEAMPGVHCAIETCGYTTDETFEDAMTVLPLIIMDLKITDPAMHKRYTGVDNASILRHLQMLCQGNTPFILRTPLIPGVNDTLRQAEEAAALLEGASSLIRMEFLPYHVTAGAKYAMLGQQYQPDFSTTQAAQVHTAPFEKRGIPFYLHKPT